MADKLRNELFKIGHILPETDEEINEFDKIIKKKELPKLPEIFSSPSELIKEGRPIIKTLNPIINNEAMARVAREGKEIPPNIIEQMKIDRANAEEKNSKD